MFLDKKKVPVLLDQNKLGNWGYPPPLLYGKKSTKKHLKGSLKIAPKKCCQMPAWLLFAQCLNRRGTFHKGASLGEIIKVWRNGWSDETYDEKKGKDENDDDNGWVVAKLSRPPICRPAGARVENGHITLQITFYSNHHLHRHHRHRHRHQYYLQFHPSASSA